MLTALAALRMPKPRLSTLGPMKRRSQQCFLPRFLRPLERRQRCAHGVAVLIDTFLRFERRGNVGVQGANSVVFFAFDQTERFCWW